MPINDSESYSSRFKTDATSKLTFLVVCVSSRLVFQAVGQHQRGSCWGCWLPSLGWEDRCLLLQNAGLVMFPQRLAWRGSSAEKEFITVLGNVNIEFFLVLSLKSV